MSRRGAALLACMVACGGPSPPTAVAPSPTAAPPAPPSATLPSPAPLASSSPDPAPSASATPPPPAETTDPCRGASYDLDAIPDCPRAPRAALSPPTLDVKLVVDPANVPSGDEVPVSLVFTNPAGDDLPLEVYPGCASFELGAYDRSGQRKDYVVVDCGFGTGCGGIRRRITLGPHGTITKHLRFRARVVKVTSKNGCNDADAGGLPPGRYELRATAHLTGWVGGTLAGDKAPTVSTPISVTVDAAARRVH